MLSPHSPCPVLYCCPWASLIREPVRLQEQLDICPWASLIREPVRLQEQLDICP